MYLPRAFLYKNHNYLRKLIYQPRPPFRSLYFRMSWRMRSNKSDNRIRDDDIDDDDNEVMVTRCWCLLLLVCRILLDSVPRPYLRSVKEKWRTELLGIISKELKFFFSFWDDDYDFNESGNVSQVVSVTYSKSSKASSHASPSHNRFIFLWCLTDFPAVFF